jgi:hypothetical protein
MYELFVLFFFFKYVNIIQVAGPIISSYDFFEAVRGTKITYYW